MGKHRASETRPISGLLMGGEDLHVPLAIPSIMAHALFVFMIA
jgi:hypothetical protein